MSEFAASEFFHGMLMGFFYGLWVSAVIVYFRGRK